MNQRNPDVDAFVRERVLPQFQPVVEEIRAFFEGYAPEVREIMSYGIPAYRRRLILAVISPTRKDITLSFSKGASFEDKYNRLSGLGHVSKSLKAKTVADLDEVMLRYYMEQALALEESPDKAGKK